MNFLEKIITYLKNLEESLKNERDSSKLKTLELRFNEIPVSTYFTFLDLYSPMDFPLEVTSEDVAKYIQKLKDENKIYFEYYLKCPSCDFDTNVISDETGFEICIRCNNSTERNKENLYIRFKKK